MARKKTDLSELTAEYKRLAKAADQRLRRLEALSEEKGFKGVKQYAYKKAMKFIEKWSGEGATRFDQNTPKRKSSLLSKIADISAFMGYKTSTKRDIKKMYKNVVKSTNALYGTDLTVDKLEDFYNSSKWQYLESKYGSDVAIRVVGELEENKDYIKEMVKEHKQVDFQLKDLNVNDAIKDAIGKYGIDVVDLY